MFLWVLALLGVASACIGARIWRRYTALVEIDRVHGSVRVRNSRPPWLNGPSGKHLSRSLARVEFIGLAHRATDDMLAKIASLTETRELVIGATTITDDGLAYVGAMYGLEDLILSNTGITDDGFAHLTRLPNLQIIRLDDTLLRTPASPIWGRSQACEVCI
jgi:hypothetical protein